MRNLPMAVLLLFVSGNLGGCGDGCSGKSAKAVHRAPAAQPTTPPATTQRATVLDDVERAEPGAPTVPWQTLLALSPATLGEFKAVDEGTGRVVNLPKGAKLSTSKRSYRHGDLNLELEAIDAVHSPGLAQIVNTNQGVDRSHGTTVFRGEPINGRPAILQWSPHNRTARVGILVGAHFIVNVAVKPVDAIEQAVGAAKALNLDALEALGTPAEARQATKTPEAAEAARVDDPSPPAPTAAPQ